MLGSKVPADLVTERFYDGSLNEHIWGENDDSKYIGHARTADTRFGCSITGDIYMLILFVSLRFVIISFHTVCILGRRSRIPIQK